MGFSFGSSKSKSRSSSNANTFVDPNQQPYLDDIRRQTKDLTDQETMPVEGVAGINNTLGNALDAGNQAGIMQANAGSGLMGDGANQAAATGAAQNFASNAMQGDAMSNIGTSIGAGVGYAGLNQNVQAATGGGVNHRMANDMGGNASQMNAASNNGINLGQAQGIGGLAANSQAASVNGYNSGLATQAGGLASTANVAQNQGFNQNNLNNYINNDVLNSQIDAASRDVTRNLQENQLVNINSQAAASGNMGSSRAGIADGIAMRGAQEQIGDISAQLRGNAYNTALGIEAGRASENAQLTQGGNQFNASSVNNMTSQGLGIAGDQAGMNAGFNQQTNLANQNAANSMTSQGVGVAANTASQNADFNQQANAANMGAQNSLIGQGYGISANQIDSNLNRSQQANLANQNAYNSALQVGSNLGQNAYNTNQQNQQFGAGMSQQIGQQGVANMQAGQNMMNTGGGMSQSVGQYGRDYDQQLLARDYQEQMSPYNSLNFYNNVVGAPNNLSTANSKSRGSSSSFSLGIG